MPNFIIQSCDDFIASWLLVQGDGAIQRLPEHSWMSDKTQKQATAKAAWAH